MHGKPAGTRRLICVRKEQHMVSLGETITIRASKFQTRYQTGDGRFAICAFTAKPAEKDKLPDGLRMYGTTAMFLASGRIPESDKGVQLP